MSPKEFAEMWGREGLVTWKAETLDSLPLSEAAKSFLREAGLPRDAGLQWHFGTTIELPSLATIVEGSVGKKPELERFQVLGVWRGPYDAELAWVCLDTLHLDRVVQVTRRANDFAWGLVNSSPSKLAECLLAFRMIYGLEEPQDLEFAASELETSIRTIDPEALEGEDSFWPGIIEDARYGM